MCLVIVQYATLADAPLLVGFNREEFFGRPAAPPSIAHASPAVVCGTDRRAGGTWLGVNEHGLFVAVTNRLKSHLPQQPRSRGLLCRDLLARSSCDEAIDYAISQLRSGRYAGANFICADAQRATVVHGGDRIETIDLTPGLHLIGNTDLDDANDPRQQLARQLLSERRLSSAKDFIDAARAVLAFRPDSTNPTSIVLRADDRGTVSSTIVTLGRHAAETHYLYADGPPDENDFADFSPLLRRVLNGQVASGSDP